MFIDVSLVEMVGLVLMSLAFLIWVKYSLDDKSEFSQKAKVWLWFVLAGVFFLLNRAFTNLEGFWYGDLFNLLEHLCALLGLVFAFIPIRKLGRRYSNESSNSGD